MLRLQCHWTREGQRDGWKTFGKVEWKMPGSHFKCSDASCPTMIPLYRQCVDNGCKKEIGYCTDHGGDDRAVLEMSKHLQKHKDKDVQS